MRLTITRFSYARPILAGLLLAGLVGCGPDSPDGVNISIDNGDGGNGENQTYTIGGSITGLNGGTVALQVNGAHTFQVSANGTYSANIEADDGFNYALTVLENPELQNCSITNGTGTISATNVGNITISCVDINSDTDALTDREELLYGTSLTDSDTDGDGFSDSDEITEFGFNQELANFRWNPLIADVPQLEIEFATIPSVWVNDSQGTTKSVTTENGGNNITGDEKSYTGTISAGFELGWEGEAKAGLLEWGNTKTSFKFHMETQHSWSVSAFSSNETNWNTAKALEENNELNGGGMSVGVILKNTGHTSFSINNLNLTASEYNFGDVGFNLIGNMSYKEGASSNQNEFQLPAGESTGIISFEKQDLTTSQALALMRSTAISVSPSSYSLNAPSEATSYLQTTQDVQAKTVAIDIDYAPNEALLASQQMKPEKHQIAVKSATRTNSATLADLLAIMAGDDSFEYAFGADTNGKNGLLSVRNQSSTGHWVIAHIQASGNTENDKVYDTLASANFNVVGVDIVRDYTAEDIIVTNGDKLSLIFFRDSDSDGLGDRIESILGILDAVDRLDYDNDGLTDLAELQGWTVNVARSDGLYAGGVQVYSDIRRADADQDGLNDLGEATKELDPNNDDTDGDTILDGVDTVNAGYLAGSYELIFPTIETAVLQGSVVSVDGISSETCYADWNANTLPTTSVAATTCDGASTVLDGNFEASLTDTGANRNGLVRLAVNLQDSSGLYYEANASYQQSIQDDTGEMATTNGWTVFSSTSSAADYWAIPDVFRYAYDTDSDGDLEFVGFHSDGVYIYDPEADAAHLATSQFNTGVSWNWENPRYVVQFNNDGIADILGYGDNGLYVALGYVSAGEVYFGAQTAWGERSLYGDGSYWNVTTKYVNDVDGDGDDDVIGFGSNGVFMTRNIQTTAGDLQFFEIENNGAWGNVTWEESQQKLERRYLDLNNDGLLDLIGFGWEQVEVSLAETTSGSYNLTALRYDLPDLGANDGFWKRQHPKYFVDLNGDDLKDIVVFGDSGPVVAINNMIPLNQTQEDCGTTVKYDHRCSPNAWTQGDTSTQMFKAYSTITGLTGIKPSSGYYNYELDVNGQNTSYEHRHPRQFVDVTGSTSSEPDGKPDLVVFHDDGVEVYPNTTDLTAPTITVTFGSKIDWSSLFGSNSTSPYWYEVGTYNTYTHRRYFERKVADVNGDGRMDIYGFSRDGLVIQYAPSPL